jgi:5'-phosphate synthase pdxT subunit
MRIGVLASQGAFIEHIASLSQLKVEALPVRLATQLNGLDGLVIPGGESTSITRLMASAKLTEAVKGLVTDGLPVFGTCAGMIVLSTPNSDKDVEPLGLMDITVKRNAFGRQVDSFETELSIPVLGKKPYPAVFIRAPLIERVNSNVEVLARLPDGRAVAARQDNRLVAAFHPELTDDLRFHRYFLEMVRSRNL